MVEDVSKVVTAGAMVGWWKMAKVRGRDMFEKAGSRVKVAKDRRKYPGHSGHTALQIKIIT
jgi:hypothetical protein